ncbi:MAG TPA: sigma-70 family RNA polymerase sigma factor [Ktedonobacterales bacterium]
MPDEIDDTDDTDDTDDATLLAGLKRRDPDAFERFFAAYGDRVYRIAVGILGDDADAQEVVQATFLSAFEALDRFEPRARLSTWLYRIAYNHALMLVRRRRPSEALPEDESTAAPMPHALVDWSALPEEQILGAEAQAILTTAIAELPAGLRAAFVLRDVEGLTTAECSEVQGISDVACKVRLHRARLALRERLSAYFGEWVALPAALSAAKPVVNQGSHEGKEEGV